MMSAEPEQENGVGLIAKERQRQIDVEGWTPEHDADHSRGVLAIAAACYALPDELRQRDLYWRHDLGQWVPKPQPAVWPITWLWKPTPDDRIRELVKASRQRCRERPGGAHVDIPDANREWLRGVRAATR